MRVYLQTFGCRANQYDSETVRAMVERSGGEMVAHAEDADVAVFNSCTVTSQAEADLRQGIRRAVRSRPALRTLVMGCAAARDAGALARLPGVQHVVAGADFPAIAQALGLAPSSLGAATAQSGARGLLRIQDGCDEHCTFCATTVARGANRSRGADALVREAEQLAGHHAEIVLTGIHIGTWGRDLGSSLGALVERLVREVPAVRFRLSSIEATEVDDRLVDCLADPARLAPHLHAPLQSGSDRVLKRMGRHWYTSASYAAAVTRLMRGKAAFGLGADVIAGFPGETDADHAASLALVRDLPFTYLHVFPYSQRPGTAAERLGGQLPAAVVHARARQLREAAGVRAAAYAASQAGTVADVVVTRGDRPEGLTGDYLAVRLEGAALPRGTRAPMRLHLDAACIVATPLVPHPV